MLKSSLITFVAIAFWLLIFEGTSRFWIHNWGNPYQRSLEVLRTTPIYGWMQRPNLDQKFYGSNIKTDSQGFRAPEETAEISKSDSLILTLGPSSAFGWGVESQDVYTDKLAEKMTEFAGRKYEALNLSQIGYSTFQGKLLSEHPAIKQARPKVVLLAFGVNDVDRYRFFFQSSKSDAEELSSTKDSLHYTRASLISGSSFLRLISSFTSSFLLNLDCRSLEQIPNRRLSAKETEVYFTELVTKYKQLNSNVVLVTTPHNYQGLDPNFLLSYEQLFAASAEAAKNRKCRTAKALASESRKLEKNVIVRDIIDLNQRLKNVAKQLDVTIVDAEELLKDSDKFLDPIHPNKEGHALIATQIFDALTAVGKSEQ